MLRLSKDAMLTALQAENVPVPPTASISQIRTLYANMLGGGVNPSDTDSEDGSGDGVAHSVANSNTTATAVTAATTSAAVIVTAAPSTVATTSTSNINGNAAATANAAAGTSTAVITTSAAVATSSTTMATTSAAVPIVPTAVAPASAWVSTASVSAAHTIVDTHNNPVFTTAGENAAASIIGANDSESDDMERQLQRLRQQKELLLLQREVNDLQAGARPLPMSDLSHIESIVSPFSADDSYDIRKWLSDLEDAFEVLRLDERAKFIAARRLLTGTAKIFTRTIVTFQYCELKRLLLEEFGRAYTNQEVYTQLRNRRFQNGETLKRYLIQMQEIASRANISETELIDFIINGLSDTNINTSVLYGAANMRELKTLLERHERIGSRTAVRAVRAPMTSVASVAAAKPAAPRVTSATSALTAVKPTAAASAEIRCFNCSKYGHYQSQCPKPKRPEGSCFRCGQLDHVYRACPLRPSTAVAAVHHNNSDATDVDNLVDRINSVQMVSVAFSSADYIKDRYTHVSSLLDSGSPTSFISERLIPSACRNPVVPSGYCGIGNTPLMSLGQVECYIKFKQKVTKHTFIILPMKTSSLDLIVGRDLLKKFRIYLCYINNVYTREHLLKLNKEKNHEALKPHVSAALRSLGLLKTNVSGNAETERLSEFQCQDRSSNTDSFIAKPNDNISDDPFAELCAIEIDCSTPSADINPKLRKHQHDFVLKVLNNDYYNSAVHQVTETDYRMKISLTTDTPMNCRPRRLSHYERGLVQEIVDDLLKRNIIRPSNSAYASPIVIVRKKNGKIRKCVDYRQLNKITYRDNYPMPVIEDCLEHLGGKSIFTLIDLRSGFHQIKMHEDSVKYTSFVTPDGQWEYLQMPFGLKNAPAQFQRFVNMIFHPLIKAGLVVVYLDDILIASVDFESHMRTLSKVLSILREYGLEIQLEKCKFAYDELDYLGYCANASGIRPSNSHLEAIQNYPIPRNKVELQRCLGLFSYFRRFVQSFSTIARPMTSLLRKDSEFELNEEFRASFASLKTKLLESPILSIYDPKRETELHCDASSVGFGAVLLQKQNDKKLHPVAYFSKTTSASESKLNSYELETLAIIYALKRFHVYLEGIPFSIVTDCHSLAQTLEKQSYSAKIARWALYLENYDYKIQHRPGKAMGHVDALSRIAAAIYDEADLDLQLQVMQCLDPVISKLKSDLEKGPVDDYILKDDLVFHISPSGTLQLYVPTGLIDNIIRFVHEKISHLGIEKTYNQIKENYWFPQMKNRIGNFIRNCLKCIIYSAPARSNQQNLHNIPKASVPFDTIHIDHFGPLPSHLLRKKYILVITDAFTKFTKLYASVSTSAKEVCKILNQYFMNYSRPRRIVSDRGSCFTSVEFSNFLDRLSIQHILNATASPQANGQVERVNRVIRPILSKISDPLDHIDWANHLFTAEYALNNTVHSSTKFKPAVLLFGVQQRGEIIDELTEYLDSRNGNDQVNLREIRQTAAANILKSQENNLKYFLKSHTPAPEFFEGDCVVVRNTDNSSGTNKKLIPRYRGPYVVHKKLPNDRYVIRDIEGFQVTQIPYDGVLEANKLRKWVAQV